MRLGLFYPGTASEFYRVIVPLKAMERRGHEVLWPDTRGIDERQLEKCDVVHVSAIPDASLQQVLKRLSQRGTSITYDTDDNVAALPPESRNYDEKGGLSGQALFSMSVRAAQLAHAFTTTNEVIAEKYRQAGVERITVIGNYLPPRVSRRRTRHDGIAIGWMAAPEHEADAVRLNISDVLRRIVAKHDKVRVECIGVDLRLQEGYRHDQWLQFEELPARIGGFDIGIAPLADMALNRARSDIKIKEYAASGVPWLASPVGPYRGLGEEQGGRLVPDDEWFDALERLVIQKRERRRLARAAKKWGEGQTIDAVADRWEQVFLEAAG